MTDKPLEGKLALVTGASRGIGAATARELAAKGAHILLAARNAKELEQVEQQIFDAGGSATIAPLDLTEGENIGRLATAVSERWGKLDILVLNAAMLGSLGPVAAIDSGEYNKILTLNLLTPQALIAAFDGLLRKSDDAHLIALTSSVAASPRAFWAAYASSKIALENLVQSYGQEVGNNAKLRVAIVDPGATRTSMRAKAYPGEDPATLKEPSVVAEAISDLILSDYVSGHRLQVARLSPA